MDTPNDSATSRTQEHQPSQWYFDTIQKILTCGLPIDEKDRPHHPGWYVVKEALGLHDEQLSAALTRVAELTHDYKKAQGWADGLSKQAHELREALRLAEQQRDEARAEADEAKSDLLNEQANYAEFRKEAWTQQEDLRAQLHSATEREKALRDGLCELVRLMDDTRAGLYKPDSFTTQPMRLLLEGTPNAVTDAQRLAFALIEHSDGSDPEGLHIFSTKEQRTKKTRELILGADNEGQECTEIDELEREGVVYFEGDPGLEWRTVYISAALSTDTGGGRG